VDRDEVVQKLVEEVVIQRVMFRVLLGILACRLNPEDPEAEMKALKENLHEGYRAVFADTAATLAADWGLPAPANLEPDLGPNSEFEAWLKRQLPDQP